MPRTKSKEKMVIISVHVPRQLLDDVDKLVMSGFFPSRSEVIRVAIRDLVTKELRSMEYNEDIIIGR